MKVYTASGWIAASSASVATLATFEFVATAGQTVFTGNDANGSSLSYVAPAIIVTLNGVRLRPGDDYTATNGTSITLVSAAALNDELVVDAFGSFLVANTYTIAQTDSLVAAKVSKSGDTMTGSLSVSNSASGSGEIVLNKTNSGTANQNGQAIEFLNYGPAATARNAGTEIGKIYFGASQPSSGAIQDAGAIACIAETQSGNNTASALVFSTNTGNAGNVERMRIDSVGRVTKPNQPAFHAHSTQNFNGTAQIPIQFSVTEFNIGGHYNPSNYRFTAPIAGRYLFTTNIAFYLNGSSRQNNISLRKNGGGWVSSDCFIASAQSNNTHTVATISIVMELAASDYVDVSWEFATANVNFYSDNRRCFFTGYLLG